MANDQNEFGLPTSKNSKRTVSSLLPKIYRTSSNQKFLQATLDQLSQPGTVKKVNGYIGRQNSKSTAKNDVFVTASDSTRQSYQLEPAAVIQDYLGNVNFYKDYIDYINHIETSNGITNNHERLNKQEFYSWNPHIDWDKFVNYRSYYWLPTGPTPIEVFGPQQEVQSSFGISEADNGNNYSYQFSQLDNENNPTVTLFRGYTYVFELNCPNNPFSIKFKRSEGDIDRFNDGVTGNGNTSGKLTFTIPLDCPSVLFYTSETNLDAGGVFHILDIDANTYLNVEQEVLGKKTFRMSNGYHLSNGMKLKFTGQVFPETYAKGFWYVEGVGDSIKLISEKDLEIVSSYSEDITLLFDDEPFDEASFSSATTFSRDKDYFVISRGSPSKNPWSRYNRWFHNDVILISNEIAGATSTVDQSARATRPIIEFEAGLKLFNFGHYAKKDVDLIDTFTDDVFSKVEGQVGYAVDEVPLVDGMRVLFTADRDSLVKNKIYTVSFVDINRPQTVLPFLGLTNIDIIEDTITFTDPHGLSTGNKVIYRNGGNLNIGGLLNGKTYYVFVVNSYTIKLYLDQKLLQLVDFLVTSPGEHSLDVIGETKKQIYLSEADDANPLENEAVIVRQGTVNQGKMYWYDGTTWNKGQEKLTVNQPPLFDVFDVEGISFSNLKKYNGSTFAGSKIFSYKTNSSGTIDPVLGFSFAYQSIDNIGDILFDFNLLSDSFTYKTTTSITNQSIDSGYVKIVKNLTNFSYANGWTVSNVTNYQPIIRNYKNETVTELVNGVKTTFNLVNNFPIDVYDNVDDLDDLVVRVYVNGNRLDPGFYTIETGKTKKYVKILESYTISETDVVSIKCFAKQPKNQNGYYEIPINLQNNPLNNGILSFTLGEVISHVESIVENLSEFTGSFPGGSNLRDLGNITSYGTKFVQHSSPLALGLLHLGSKEFNVLKALQKSRDDYGRFKRAFLVTAANSGIDTDVREHVDHVLSLIAQNRSKFESYYFSDMFGLGAYNRLEYVVYNSLVKRYPITDTFSMSSLSNKAVYVYINGEQLVHNRDYVFGDDSYITILIDLIEDAVIEIIEYESTDGCYCPSTPSKLGLYPAYEPKKFIDDTYLTPTEVIQGHDGSITVAFGDFRDDLLLELEKRIFNNIKISYDIKKFNLNNFIPTYDNSTSYSRNEFEKVLGTFFYQWTTLIGEDFTKQMFYDRLNPFTFNFRGNYTPDGADVPAFWRGVYKWLLNTDRPHTHPWECLNYTIEPTWWQEVYGPAPYTSDNQILWEDINQGLIRIPGTPPKKYTSLAKSILSIGAPVDSEGNLLDPINANFISGTIKPTDEGFYVFGDQGPIETTWRRSSYYPFALIQAIITLNPSSALSLTFDLSRITRNLADQLVYKETGLRIRLEDIVVPTLPQSTTRVYASGLVNYVIDYITSDSTALLEQYQDSLSNLKIKIGSKLGGFTAKNKINLVLDSKNPNSTNGIFVPEENFTIFLNTSSPVKKLNYSGIIITKYADGFELRGYNFDNPFFTYYSWETTDRLINVGGISESYVTWAEGKTYAIGVNIKYNNVYYKATSTFTSSTTFDLSKVVKLAALPMVGGVDVKIRKTFNKREELILNYGTKLSSIQEVSDFIQGYSEHLKDQGFVFDTFNDNLQTIADWETALKEFLFWTTQNWTEGSVLSISPSANLLIVNSDYSVVNDVLDPFYEYKIFRVDGQKLEHEFTSVLRTGNVFSLQPINTNQGIYGASLYLVQKEHVLVLDNKTLFNDVIYDVDAGIKQDRIKLLGYLTTGWDGGFNIPGFLFDQAEINDWQPWIDYSLGDVVKYGAFYYSSLGKIIGTGNFDETKWNKLQNKPQKTLKPNWDYRSQQFTDFYDLDTSNFDAEQQKFAQHLIGYQKRQYLQNIIQDDVSQYNFYQGYIREKGTKNSLTKLFDVLSSDSMDSLTFNEEWALRIGQYGASGGFNEIEFILDQSRFKLSPQPIEIVDQIDNNLIDFVYKQTPSDFYIKPKNYSGQVWPTKNNLSNYLRSPGFVRYDDVKLHIDSLEDLVGVTTFELIDGDYVWTAFENALSSDFWNIYRTTSLQQRLQSITYENGTLTIDFYGPAPVTAGEVIGILYPTFLNGFYKVDSTYQGKVYIKTKITGWQALTDLSKTLVFNFVSCKISSIDDLNSSIPQRIKNKELVWSKDNGKGRWAVYQNNKVFTDLAIDSTTVAPNLNFGKTLSVTLDGTTAAISSLGSITLLTKTYSSTSWGELQKLTPVTFIANYGSACKFSPDGKILVVASGDQTLSRAEIFVKNDVGLYGLTRTINNPSITPDFIKSVDIVNNGDDNYIISLTTGLLTKFYSYHYDIIPVVLPTVLLIASAKVKMSDQANIVLVSTAHNNTVKVYEKQTNNSFVFSQNLVGNQIATGDEFGASIDILKDASTIVVSSPKSDIGSADKGKVSIFTLSDNTYSLTQEIFSPKKLDNENYGVEVQFTNNGKSLIVISGNGYLEKVIDDWDSATTIFDNNSTRFKVSITGGRVDIFDKYNINYIYGESLESNYIDQVDPDTGDILSSGLSSDDGFGSSLAVSDVAILVGAPYHDVDNTFSKKNVGRVYYYYKSPASTSWTVLHTQQANPDVKKIKKAFLYNRKTQELVKYLDVVDVRQGKIPGIADEEIRFKSYFDPAVYSIGSSSVNVNDGIKWTKDKVGYLWWDLSRAKFLENSIGEVVYRSTTWNKLYDTASIDIYEWVESKYLPSEWDKLADTEKGLASNISGTSKYGDSTYSVIQTYDTVSKKFINVYYYWVKNKTVVPNAKGRNLSSAEISNLIKDPVSYGYPCLALTGPNSFSLVNVENLLRDTDVVLSVQYWTIDNQEINIHSQWSLINETSLEIPTTVEQKWIHSLIGRDDNDRVIPDLKLPIKQRYGIEFRPRQSMFINRGEALKLFIEGVNSILEKNLITDNYDITPLERLDDPPSEYSGLWDVSVATNNLVRFISTGVLSRAELEPVIENGKIISVSIINAGKGYVNAPYITVTGIGKEAKLRTKLDDTGQVVGVDIINSGYGYNNETFLTVRDFSVLIESDENSYDKWGIYSYDTVNKIYSKVNSQSYDVKNFWDKIDWYAEGYNQFTKIDHSVNNTYELTNLQDSIGDVIKVKNIGSGGWVLLEKFANNITVDYTLNYAVVGRENGTIKFRPTLYNFQEAVVGYDSSLYDSNIYDAFAYIELKIIIDCIKNNILIEELRSEYIKLFFSSIRYVLKEQPFVDWVTKTSFVKSQHNVGYLKQKVNYSNDNLPDYEAYINEVKPYRTNIREFVSSYQNIDNTQTMVSDFDVIPYVDSDYNIEKLFLQVNEVNDTAVIDSSSDTILDYYPWKNWKDNLGFTITSIEIADGGSGYINPPIVNIIGGYGSGATAKAFISNGTVNRITVTSPGYGYLKAPTVVLEGGLSPTGVAGRASAIIETQAIRSNKISVKFDRITKNYFVYEINEVEIQYGTGSRLQFDLKYSPNKTIGKSKIRIIDGETYKKDPTNPGTEVLRNEYKFLTKKSKSRGYTSYYGSLVLSSAPPRDSVIIIEYEKDINYLSAADRINFFYNVETGKWGKDLAQLMTGIDYGGVNITGLGFKSTGGWDALPWFTDAWDSFDEDYDNLSVVVGANDHTVLLKYVPISGQILNIYINKLIDVTDPLTNSRYEGNGVTKDFKIPNTPFSPRVYVDNILKNFGTDYSLVPFSPVSRIVRFVLPPAVNKEIKIQLYGKDMRLDDPNYSIDTDLITFHGNPLYSITDSPYDGVDVLGFDGSSYISAPQNIDYAFGTRNFTIELFVRPDNLPLGDWNPILSIGQTGGGKEIRIGHNIDGTGVGFLIPNNTNDDDIYLGFGHLLTPNRWHHIALVREDDKAYFYITSIDPNDPNNQIQFSHTLNSIDFNFAGLGPLRIGYGVNPTDGYFTGSVSNIRILNGTALYNTTFELPSTPFTDIDDTVFLQLNTHATNPDVKMKSIVADGVMNEIELPSYIQIDDNDKITIRKVAADGSNVIGYTELDTQLSGGEFEGSAYSSATGLAPEDIIVDGDGFVTETNSETTEELLSGRVFDSVAIKVFHRPSGGAPKILFKNYVSNGVDTEFVIGQYFPTERSVVVKVGGTFMENSEYVIDWQNNSISLVSPAPEGQVISIVSFGFNASNILDNDYFIGDGVTEEFVTKAPWLDKINATVLVNGAVKNYILFKTDSTYNVSNLVGIKFAEPIPANALVNYLLDTDPVDDITQQTSSVMKSQTINFVSGTSTYSLDNLTAEQLTALNLQPYENNVLVRVGQTILQPSKTLNFILKDDVLEYTLSPYEANEASFDITQVRVFIAGIELKVGKEFTVDFYGITVKINKRKYIDGAPMIVVISAQSDYKINSNGSITFSNNYTTGTKIEVISFYNHAVLKVERSVNSLTPANTLVPGSADYYTFANKLGKRFKLDKSVVSDDYVWVIKNGQLLSHSVDYTLELDHKSVRLKDELVSTDVVEVIAFSSDIRTYPVSYMQFKDILNRTHFKRLNKNKQTRLAQDLSYNDTYILLEDASQLTLPSITANKPGVLEIKGERIEYFEIDGNVLTHLRRGTLGTGVPEIHKEGSYVIDIGPSETIPYLDDEVLEKITSNGTKFVDLTFIPTKGDQNTSSPNYEPTGVVNWFVDLGYTFTGNYSSITLYVPGDIVIYQNNYYKNIVNSKNNLPTNTTYWSLLDTEIPVGYGVSHDIEVFVGGYDLTTTWQTNTVYKVGDLVTKDSTSYKCMVEHTSSTSFIDDYENWKLFCGNIKLNKKPYSCHDINKFIYSPEGDVKIEADFSVDGTSKQLRLTNEVAVGTQIVVAKKTGVNWDNNLYGDSKIAGFLRAAPAVWYTDMKND